MTNVLIYNEGVHDKNESIKAIYPQGMHGAIKSIFPEDKYNVVTTTLDTVENDITDEVLRKTDVLIWWGHMRHAQVPDSVVASVVNAVHNGMGLIVLHSGHESKVFKAITGAPCSLGWRDADRERLWTVSPSHPIAQGIPKNFVLEHEEMYSEPFFIPKPDDVVFISWFEGGEVFRSGVTFTSGIGKIFYFRPGHEGYPTFYNEYVRRIILNAVNWAVPIYRDDVKLCPHMKEKTER